MGLATGLCTFLIIGMFHPLCVKAEYHLGARRAWWWFLALGLVAAAASVWVDGLFWSTLLGVLAFSSFWTILEVFQQQKRVQRGWFPRNPNRRDDRKPSGSSDKER